VTTPLFSRDRLTWLLYTLTVMFGYGVGLLGPAMPLLRDDLDINRTVGGLHFTTLALGAVLFGFFADRLIRRLGRHTLFWAGSGLVIVGAALLGAAPHPAVSLLGTALIGGPGTAMLTVVQATLADRHADHRAVALTEANVAMASGTMIPSLVIGAFVGIGIGWRPGAVVPILIWLIAATRFRGLEFPPANPAPAPGQKRRLPRPYWFFWGGIVGAVGGEWSLGAWGAGYLVDIAGTAEGTASLLMTVYFGSIAGGRVVGSRLARTFSPPTLLASSAGVAVVGTILLWQSSTTIPIVTGLLVAGLGVSMLFPMLFTLAVETAPEQSDTVAARISIAAGGSVVVAPLSLGAFADATSLQSAFMVVPFLFAAIVVLMLLGRRAAGRPTPQANQR